MDIHPIYRVTIAVSADHVANVPGVAFQQEYVTTPDGLERLKVECERAGFTIKRSAIDHVLPCSEIMRSVRRAAEGK